VTEIMANERRHKVPQGTTHFTGPS